MEAKADATIPIYAELARASLREEEWPFLIVWSVAHDAASANYHPGWITRRELADSLKGIYGPPYIRQFLRDNRARRWFLVGKGQRVGLAGAKRVALSFGLSSLGCRQLVKLSVLREGRAKRRGFLLSACLPERHPISQRTIHEEMGVAPRTVSKYIAIGCFAAIRQDAQFDFRATPDQVRAIAYENAGLGFYCMGVRLRKRLANRYRPLTPRIHAGPRTKTLERDLRAKVDIRLQPFMSQKRSKPRARVFFDNPVKWLKCKGLKLGAGKWRLVWPKALDFAYAKMRDKENLWVALQEEETP